MMFTKHAKIILRTQQDLHINPFIWAMVLNLTTQGILLYNLLNYAMLKPMIQKDVVLHASLLFY